MRFTRPLIVTVAAAAVLLTAASGASAFEGSSAAPPSGDTPGPLRILLTNDDGWDAPGITATYRALTAAGHDVTMVAPAQNQSGKSAAIDFQGKLTVTHPSGDPKVYSVTSTPAGSAMFGINEVFKDAKPDLVVSGTNVGSNVGFDTNYSGTVGAAVVASGAFGIPAIAISTDTSRDPELVPAYDQTAALLVRILDGGVPRTSPGTVLNINYPLLKDGATAPKGMKYTPMSSASAADIRYSRIDDTTYEIKPGRAATPPAVGTDFAELDAGFVTFTLLDADRTADRADAATITGLVRSLS
ncbi:5'/3'-nucleotidase SurE [Rhodococcus sp. NPDC058532]|uniref:5'/3'-nucleotidase SurE n=1 Tax=Rhodococcus sp. NPDC058532 TaxID=3346540 RepID=UPI003662A614